MSGRLKLHIAVTKVIVYSYFSQKSLPRRPHRWKWVSAMPLIPKKVRRCGCALGLAWRNVTHSKWHEHGLPSRRRCCCTVVAKAESTTGSQSCAGCSVEPNCSRTSGLLPTWPSLRRFWTRIGDRTAMTNDARFNHYDFFID